MRIDVTEDANLAEGGEKKRDKCTSAAWVATRNLPSKVESESVRHAEIKTHLTITDTVILLYIQNMFK